MAPGFALGAGFPLGGHDERVGGPAGYWTWDEFRRVGAPFNKLHVLGLT